ncbi:hypothetical protein [Streptomyces fuscichromogenes]|uniref:Uncharacterized protein n=1 Tax=Streptomyces fuscichromogenes TaxID=1324013 RepID=A0A917XPA7_9ACTN|nr:hypothetical protein [Streptomyces fuscichromogenes]GGN45986.1 hypothetical protein GCM10011578_098450 [Streptomyces fuscichromogenes]
MKALDHPHPPHSVAATATAAGTATGTGTTAIAGGAAQPPRTGTAGTAGTVRTALAPGTAVDARTAVAPGTAVGAVDATTVLAPGTALAAVDATTTLTPGTPGTAGGAVALVVAPGGAGGNRLEGVAEFGTGSVRLRCAAGPERGVLTELGLGGYRPVPPGPGTGARLAEAADTLAELSPFAAGVVRDMVGAVVLLEPRAGRHPLGATMSSYSSPRLPSTVFVTELGMHRLPPGFMFAEPSVYSLQESLFHEALLLWLNEAHRISRPFRTVRSRAVNVYVSWHNAWWSAERCLRELFVFAHLPALRAAALERARGPQRALLAAAHRSASACARELLGSLGARPELFTRPGLELLEQIARLLPRRRAA